MKRPLLSALATLGLLSGLSGCDMVVLSPSGYVAAQQSDMLVTSVILMLIIIIPVMGLTIFFGWRYKASRKSAYDPDWHHSTSLELVIWAAPLMIIICLGAITWVGTHHLDPFKKLERIGERRPVPQGIEPLEVEVTALDWKWLFIYPQYGIASVNEMAAPVDRPINFRLTSQNVMNAFFVPSLAGMIYTMPGMTSQLHAVMNFPGEYQGISANYSGAGFSKMRFDFHAVNGIDFDRWVANVRGGGGMLGRAEYMDLAAPSEGVPPMHFGDVDPDLFRRIVNRCVEEGSRCNDEMAPPEAHGDADHAAMPGHPPAGEKHASAAGAAPAPSGASCTPAQSLETYGPDTALLLSPPPAPRGSDETL